MGKKKSDEAGTTTKSQPSKDGKKEKLSVSAMLASMDQKPDKTKKAAASSKPKPKAAPKASSYTDGIDLPPSDDEEEDYASEEEQKSKRTETKILDTSITDKELKKQERRKKCWLPRLQNRQKRRP